MIVPSIPQPRPYKAAWLILGLSFMLLFAVWVSNYGERTQIEQKRLELSQNADQRELCQLALDAYRDSKYFPFADSGQHTNYILPSDCVGIIQ